MLVLLDKGEVALSGDPMDGVGDVIDFLSKRRARPKI